MLNHIPLPIKLLTSDQTIQLLFSARVASERSMHRNKETARKPAVAASASVRARTTKTVRAPAGFFTERAGRLTLGDPAGAV